jgi:Lipocalin-like domain
MRLSARPLALIAVCSLAMLCTACSSNAKKIVGKWKFVSMTPKDGKEQKLEFMGMSAVMEFTADGNIKVGLDTSNLPAELKQKMESDKEAAAKMNEMKQVGKYKVSGDTIEFQDIEKSGDSPLGKNNKGKLTFDGDTLTITGDDGSFKLSRVK